MDLNDLDLLAERGRPGGERVLSAEAPGALAAGATISLVPAGVATKAASTFR